MPTASIITPTHNRATMLKEAIESVLAQTYQDWEHIIVDDGSTDGTMGLVTRYAGQDPRIRYVFRRHGGLPAARNTGLLAARGRYLAFLDDDDLFLPDKLKRQVATLEQRPELCFIYAPVYEVHDNREGSRYLPRHLGRTFAELFDGATPQVSSIMVRRACLEEVGGFDERLPHCQDYDLWLRLAARFPFDYLTDPVGVYRRHRTNMSRKLIGLIASQLTILSRIRGCRALGVTAAAKRRRLATLAYQLARYQFEARQYRRAALSFFRAVGWRPDIGLLVREYAGCAPQSGLRKAVKPYAGIAYCLVRGVAHANR
ncbi:MAG: glycosyltransferase [Candidatus Omnitrophota bacterium]|nr:glycosyltransferase [Candidatus Omnitrophota bacterium]